MCCDDLRPPHFRMPQASTPQQVDSWQILPFHSNQLSPSVLSGPITRQPPEQYEMVTYNSTEAPSLGN
ncbi:hypothetical protein VN97_g757 [Penicillium thymicola]|uniref:Uncharacterized protein n=1 Tax=Penicillium thymicola TaxID=293382 RepID=A0AAI9XCP7_PENTH|nr:hypothetical protein VN97_g757 [Penicillium thymicola]